MSFLPCPAPFGDAPEPSPIQDANTFLAETLRLVRLECAPSVALMAAEVLGILSDNDGMLRRDLETAVAESLDVRLIHRGPIGRAIDELAIRNVLIEADGRFALNPAVAALIGRDAA